MFCPKCGKEIPDGSIFCPVCGANIAPGAPGAPNAGSAPAEGAPNPGPAPTAPGGPSAPNGTPTAAPAPNYYAPPAAPKPSPVSELGIGLIIGLCAAAAIVLFSFIEMIILIASAIYRPLFLTALVQIFIGCALAGLFLHLAKQTRDKNSEKK